MNPKNKNIIIFAICILVMLVIAYANHFQNTFHFDDFHAIVDNVHIRTLNNIPKFFHDPSMFSADPAHYGLRPVITTSLAIDYWLGNSLDPFYFHLSTFIWHILLCVLLFLTYRKLLNISFSHHWIGYCALFATGWFALHTANAETINYIISRSDVLSTFFILASFYIFIAYPEKRKWYLYIIPAVLGVFAKETVLVLIILLFFYINLFEKKLSIADLFQKNNFKKVLNTIVTLLPILFVVIAVQVYTLSKIDSIPGITNPYGYYWLTQCYVWLHYFTSFFLPTSLSADTDWKVILTVFDARIIAGLLFVVLLIVAIFKTSKKVETKPISFGLIWFAASLLPTSLAPFAEVTNDHRMYFAFVGLSLSVVTYITQWLMKYEKQISSSKINKILIGAVAFTVLSLNAYGVHQRNKIWKTEESLWYDVTINSPLNGRGLMNYGLTQMAIGNYTTALEYFNRALEFTPNYSSLYINIAIAQGGLNQFVDAEINFKKAISLAPKSFGPYAYYARFLNQKLTDRDSEAKKMAEKAMTYNPNSLLNLNVLMSIYNNLQLWDDLKKVANHTLSILPNDTNAQAYLLAATNRTPFKSSSSKGTSVEKPVTAEDYLNLSLTLYNDGKFEDCIEACKSALKLNPNYADAYSNMGAAHNMLKQWGEGIDACEKALKIDPNHKLAKGNLNWALRKKQ